ncbi:hypothetical protein ABE42_28715 [Bacillus thuringiensis]|uniref:hypothetical protein n=2 Tax=Bacillus TaxID=1386 RepID=UPI0002DFECD0|nr:MULTISPECIES: hypothetical protein [Bacillus]KFL79266.1 hypothetical protein DJ50_5557 [Bacillus cereus ATCC 10876]MBG9583095.1 hypothetical protein [Bacillus thuringiensis]MBG9866194.1 hypothetical protein [Bacillus cereus]MBO1132293.1 hypothetical protein [Bacillus cereus]MDR4130015.1 hypothetical protein [Bacillus cereus ATCC 10876]
MRPLMVCNVHELWGRSFLCAYVYRNNELLAQITAPLEEKPLVEKLREIVWCNCDDLPSFDIWTSTEDIYLACLGETDITGHYKTKEDTSETFRHVEDERTQTALIDVYELKDPNEITQIKQIPKWRTILTEWLRKGIKLLEGETKNG